MADASIKEQILKLLPKIQRARALAVKQTAQSLSPLAASIAGSFAAGGSGLASPVDSSNLTNDFIASVRSASKVSAGEALTLFMKEQGLVYAIGRDAARVHLTFAGNTDAERLATFAKTKLRMAHAVLVECAGPNGPVFFIQETASDVAVAPVAGEPLEVMGGVVSGRKTGLRVALLDTRARKPKNAFTAIDWTEYVQGILPPEDVSAPGYSVNAKQPYGPAWGATRPPGTPANLRLAGVATRVTPLPLPADAYTVTARVTYSPPPLFQGRAHDEYDNRPGAREGNVGLADPGPFGDQRGRGIDTAGRPVGRARVDRYGAFLWSAAEWVEFSQGLSVSVYNKDTFALEQIALSAPEPVTLTHAHEVPPALEQRAITAFSTLITYMAGTQVEPVFQGILLDLYTRSFSVFKRCLSALNTLQPATDEAGMKTGMRKRNAQLYELLTQRGLDLTADAGADVRGALARAGAYSIPEWRQAGETYLPAGGVEYGGATASAPPNGSIVLSEVESVPAQLAPYVYKNAWEGAHAFTGSQVGSRKGVPVGFVVLHWGGETREIVIRNLGDAKSTHYTVSVTGEIHQHAYLSDATWHGGVQNAWSIGIDLCTPGFLKKGDELKPRFSAFTPVTVPLFGSVSYARGPVDLYESTHMLLERLRALYPQIGVESLGLVRDAASGDNYVIVAGGYYFDVQYIDTWYGVTSHGMIAKDDRDRPARVDDLYMFIYHCLRRAGNTSEQAYQNATRTIGQRPLPANDSLPPRIKLLTQ